MYKFLLSIILLVTPVPQESEIDKYRVWIYDAALEQTGSFIFLDEETIDEYMELMLTYREEDHPYVHSVNGGVTWTEPVYSPWDQYDEEFMKLLDSETVWVINYDNHPGGLFEGEIENFKIIVEKVPFEKTHEFSSMDELFEFFDEGWNVHLWLLVLFNIVILASLVVGVPYFLRTRKNRVLKNEV